MIRSFRCHDYCSITNIAKEPAITGPLLPPAGAAPNFAEATYRRWFVGSRPMLREPCGVSIVWATRYLSGESWWITVRVPSALEAKAFPEAGSYPAPSTPIPIGRAVS